MTTWDRETMRNHQRQRRHANRKRAVDYLGGCCNKCGVIDDGKHEFDHVDPFTKESNVSEILSYSWEAILDELSKCQLLCNDCHKEKTLRDKGQVPALGTHGTLSSYRYCKCDECRAAKSAWMRDYYQRRKSKAA